MVPTPPSVRVVEAVAREEGVPPTELSPTLMTAIDPDALDTLFEREAESSPEPVEIEFEYRGYVVRVRNGQTMDVTVREARLPTDAADSAAGQRAEAEE